MRASEWSLVLALALCSGIACGGSSSETPPPLEPDPRRLLAAPAASAPAAASGSTDALQHSTEPYSGDGAEFGLEAGPAPASAPGTSALQTWGSSPPVVPLRAARPRPESNV
ncbi:MAG TPA: hypothetical protein VJU61_15105, partial [Polyangiaceae bacterium]|nr:hypothetical protein [Polyangiaceae bacterium]